MKNIFKKNQIIITALAIMIAIAGYLSFTNKDNPNGKGLVQTANPDQTDNEVYTELDENKFATSTTTGNDTTTIDDTNTTNTNTGNNNNVTTGALEKDTLNDTNKANTTGEDNAKTNSTQNDDNDELGEISDEDILASAKDVADNGELKSNDGVPGEAVLASATLDAGYFLNSKMKREQVRASNREIFREIIENPDISDKEKKGAINGMIKLTETAEKESAAEISLEAKGFDGVVVSINNGEAEVVVNAAGLTDQQLAIIEDVVKKKTGIEVEHIGITPVIVEE
jgi:stage III sporulation protein AH